MNDLDASASLIRQQIPDIAGLWLFGSRAAGTALADSDIDLAVLPSGRLDRVKLWEIAQSIACLVGKDVDLIDLLDASTVLRFEILSGGKLVYCADRFKCDLFETEALADYLRFEDERKELLADIQERGRVFGQHG